MSTEHVQAMIDYLLERYGLEDADSRVLALAWIQEAEGEAWSRGSWWFKTKREDLALVGGTRRYSVSVRFNRIRAVEAGDGGALTRLSPSDFRFVIGADATAGDPQLWCPMEPSTTGHSQIEVWPVPAEAGTLKVVYEQAAATLEDATDSTSGFPPDWRHIVLLRAEVLASLHQGQQGQAQGFMTQYEEQITALLELNSRQPTVDG